LHENLTTELSVSGSQMMRMAIGRMHPISANQETRALKGNRNDALWKRNDFRAECGANVPVIAAHESGVMSDPARVPLFA